MWGILIVIGLLGVAVAYIRWSIFYSKRVQKLLAEYTSPTALPTTNASTGLSVIADRPVFSEFRNHIHQINQNSGRSDAQLVNDLTSALADMQLIHRFTTTHDHLFRSQWNFLRALNTAPDGQASRTSAEAFFDTQKLATSDMADKTFDSWLSWLVGRGLITGTVDTVRLTPAGQEFLVWCVKNRKPEPPEGL